MDSKREFLPFDAPAVAPAPPTIPIGAPLALSVATSKQLSRMHSDGTATGMAGAAASHTPATASSKSSIDTKHAPPSASVSARHSSIVAPAAVSDGFNPNVEYTPPKPTPPVRAKAKTDAAAAESGGAAVSAARSANELRVKPPSRRPCDALQQMCLQYLSVHLSGVSEIDALPEGVAIQLLYLIFRGGALTPRTARLFMECRHTVIVDYLQQTINLNADGLGPTTRSCREKF